MTKKLAIVHDFLVRYGGAEALVKAWSEEFPDAPIFTLFYDEEKMGKFFPKERVKTSFLQSFYNLTKKYTWMLPLMPYAIETFDLSEYDVVLSSSAAFSHGVLTNPWQKHISYVHSPARWAWDWHEEFMKERQMNPLKQWIFETIINRFKNWDTLSADRPDMILAASNVVKERIKKYWNMESEVVFPFADTERFVIPAKAGIQDKHSIPYLGDIKTEGMDPRVKPEDDNKDYFLIVAQLVPYKKLEIAIDACEELGLPLKIVGEGICRKDLEKRAKGNIEFLGAKYGEELVEIMQGAKAFLFPSVDDFGITPVEAMACGVPVVAYRAGGALDTVVEGVSGVFFYEQSKESLKKVLSKTDFRNFTSQRIREVAETFSKERHLTEIQSHISF